MKKNTLRYMIFRLQKIKNKEKKSWKKLEQKNITSMEKERKELHLTSQKPRK